MMDNRLLILLSQESAETCTSTLAHCNILASTWITSHGGDYPRLATSAHKEKKKKREVMKRARPAKKLWAPTFQTTTLC